MHGEMIGSSSRGLWGVGCWPLSAHGSAVYGLANRANCGPEMIGHRGPEAAVAGAAVGVWSAGVIQPSDHTPRRPSIPSVIMIGTGTGARFLCEPAAAAHHLVMDGQATDRARPARHGTARPVPHGTARHGAGGGRTVLRRLPRGGADGWCDSDLSWCAAGCFLASSSRPHLPVGTSCDCRVTPVT